MVSANDDRNARPAWFVRASDQTERFVSEGIWENGYGDLYIDHIRQSILPGDRIAIRSGLLHKGREGLSFDNRGYDVPFMRIEAIGEVVENIGDGYRLKVDWTRVEPSRKWYFFTYGRAVWEVQPDGWRNKALIRFAFEGENQDITRFYREWIGDIEEPENGDGD